MPRVKKQWKQTHIRTDRIGNSIIVSEEPVYGTRRFELHLVSEEFPRKIGEVDRKTKIIFMRRDRAKHLMREMNAYGFNYHVMKESAQFNHVLLQVRVYDDYYEYYLIPKSFNPNIGCAFSKNIAITEADLIK